MSWITGIQKAIDYIEDNICEKIDYDKVAELAFVSNFHFQKLFTLLFNCTIGEYIRNRRMTLAAFDVVKSEMKIIDIALKYGYDSADGFSRAFARFHGVNPTTAQDSNVELKYYPRLSIKVVLEGGQTKSYKKVNKNEIYGEHTVSSRYKAFKAIEPVNGITLTPNVENIEFINMPEARIIGRTVRYISDCENTVKKDWNIYNNKIKPIVDKLPKLIPNAVVECTHDYWKSDNTYASIFGAIFPKDTIVPNGLDYLDLPAMMTIKGVWGEWLNETNNRLLEYGYHCGGGIWYNAVIIIDGEPYLNEKDEPIGRLLSQICDVHLK